MTEERKVIFYYGYQKRINDVGYRALKGMQGEITQFIIMSQRSYPVLPGSNI